MPAMTVHQVYSHEIFVDTFFLFVENLCGSEELTDLPNGQSDAEGVPFGTEMAVA